MRRLPVSRRNRHTRRMLRCMIAFLFSLLPLAASAQPPLVPHQLPAARGKTITLSLARGFQINVALAGLHRVRFFAMAPDHRLFVTDMYDRTDNTRGAVYILDGWNPNKHTPSPAPSPTSSTCAIPTTSPSTPTRPDSSGSISRSPIACCASNTKLATPHPPAHRSPRPLSRLWPQLQIRRLAPHPHRPIRKAPSGADGKPEDKLFVTVGSSCNACIEKEPIRASLSVMNPDGTRPAHRREEPAQRRRHAVGRCRQRALRSPTWATTSSAIHAPEDPFFAIPAQQIERAIATHQPLDYGWPYCYFENGDRPPRSRSSANHPTLTATPCPPPIPHSPRTAPRSAFALFPDTDHAAEALFSGRAPRRRPSPHRHRLQARPLHQHG